MATNPYFNWTTATNEQGLIKSLIKEATKNAGIDVLYLPRRKRNYDDMYNQDTMSEFDTIYTMEMYMKNFESYGNEGGFMSKFGFDVRDRLTMDVSTESFIETIGVNENTTRPMEGDLIWYPPSKRIFEIVYVDTKERFYPAGINPICEVVMELFEYNNEKFATGNAEIDAIEQNFSTNEFVHQQEDINGNPLFYSDGSVVLDTDYEPSDVDPEYDNDLLDDKADQITSDVSTPIINPYT